MIKKIITYLLVFLSILYVYRSLLYSGAKRNKAGIFNKYNELFVQKNNSYNTLFLGSSRAEMHFDTETFDAITRQNSYNLGNSGAWPKMSYALLKTYCSQHQLPKNIVYNVDYFWLQNENDKLLNCPSIFPYLGNKTLRKNLNNIDGRYAYFYINPLQSLPYTQLNFLSASLHGWLNKPGMYDSLWHKGFYKNRINEVPEDFPEQESEYINQINRNYIDSIIQFSRKNHIKLTLITTPIVKGSLKNNAKKINLRNAIQNIAIINKLRFIDYTDSSLCNDPNLFSDKFHLNYIGAKKFTSSFTADFANKN